MSRGARADGGASGGPVAPAARAESSGGDAADRPAVARVAPVDRGTAVVEFVLLGVVLLVPLLYLTLALSAVQRSVYGVTQAAREAGRAYVTGTAVTAAARADYAARLALADQGLPADGVEIRYAAADSDCAAAGTAPWPLGPGQVFAVCVTRPLLVPAVPGFLTGDRNTVTGRYLVHADEHRDYGDR